MGIGSNWGFLRRLLCPARRLLQLLFPSSNSSNEWNLVMWSIDDVNRLEHVKRPGWCGKHQVIYVQLIRDFRKTCKCCWLDFMYVIMYTLSNEEIAYNFDCPFHSYLLHCWQNRFSCPWIMTFGVFEWSSHTLWRWWYSLHRLRSDLQPSTRHEATWIIALVCRRLFEDVLIVAAAEKFNLPFESLFISPRHTSYTLFSNFLKS